MSKSDINWTSNSISTSISNEILIIVRLLIVIRDRIVTRLLIVIRLLRVTQQLIVARDQISGSNSNNILSSS